jgi:carboxylesterase
MIPHEKFNMNYIVPGSEPYYLPGGATGCLLLHGFTASPAEMRPLGEFLASRGYSVLGMRLAGHATYPNDLKHTRWVDWLDDVEDGFALLSSICTRRVLIGQSLGGVIALLAAARFHPEAVIAISAPYGDFPKPSLKNRLRMRLHPTIRKVVERFPSDHPLYHRRELNYPAYPEFPRQILPQLDQIILAMMENLAQVHVPVLLVNSRDDRAVPFDCQQAIADHLGSSHIETQAFDGMDHSMVMDPNRQVVFDTIQDFLNRIITGVNDSGQQ